MMLDFSKVSESFNQLFENLLKPLPPTAPIDAALQAAVEDLDSSADDVYGCDDDSYSPAQHEAMELLGKICADSFIRQALYSNYRRRRCSYPCRKPLSSTISAFMLLARAWHCI